jgi:Predicted membrane protein
MKHKSIAERFCLTAHVVSTLFGLAGLLFILPNPELIANLPPMGMNIFVWSMATGGVAYIVFGAAALALYGYRTLGLGTTLAFMIPSILLSLSSELLGTSTGFPFGHYQYLSGLGYKIAGLVPFTIPLSWFYYGLNLLFVSPGRFKIKNGRQLDTSTLGLSFRSNITNSLGLSIRPSYESNIFSILVNFKK